MEVEGAGGLAVEQARRYREVAALQLSAWNEAAGWFYWNYQLLRDKTAPFDEAWKESWDMTRCWQHGWFPEEF